MNSTTNTMTQSTGVPLCEDCSESNCPCCTHNNNDNNNDDYICSHCNNRNCLFTRSQDCKLDEIISRLDLSEYDDDIVREIKYLCSLEYYIAIDTDPKTKRRYYKHRSLYNAIINVIKQINDETTYIITALMLCLTRDSKHNLEGVSTFASLAEMLSAGCPSSVAYAIISEYFRPLDRWNNIENDNGSTMIGVNSRQLCEKKMMENKTTGKTYEGNCKVWSKEDAEARMPPVSSIARICEGRQIPMLTMGMGGTGCSVALTQVKKFTDKSKFCFHTGLGVHMACMTCPYRNSYQATETQSQYEVQCTGVTSTIEGMDPAVAEFVNKAIQRIKKAHPNDVIPELQSYSDYMKAQSRIEYCVSDMDAAIEQRAQEKAAAAKARKEKRAKDRAESQEGKERAARKEQKRMKKAAEEARLKEEKQAKRMKKAAEKAEKEERVRLNKEKRAKRQHTQDQKAKEAEARFRAMGILK